MDNVLRVEIMNSFEHLAHIPPRLRLIESLIVHDLIKELTATHTIGREKMKRRRGKIKRGGGRREEEGGRKEGEWKEGGGGGRQEEAGRLRRGGKGEGNTVRGQCRASWAYQRLPQYR